AVAHGVVRARGPVRDVHVLATVDRIARVGGADVAVVAVERRAGHAHAGLAGLAAVAHRVVRARRPVGEVRVLADTGVADVGGALARVVAVSDGVAGPAARDRGVLAAAHRIAGVDRAGVLVVAVERGARRTRPRLAYLGAVAEVAVEARGPVGDVRVPAPL